MLLIFVHGWSVTDTETYGELPEALEAAGKAAGLDITTRHINLGRYISFHDEVRMADLARAFGAALREQIPGNGARQQAFSCVTHSTGAPVIRTWIDAQFGANGMSTCPLRHLVMLAPANHGSALAQLGKERVGRIKAWCDGIEPGTGVLDWLELGSGEQIALNLKYLEYKPGENDFFPFVLTGQTIDAKLYDHVNNYTGEEGSDGVVRVAAANLNFRYVRMVQTADVLYRKPTTYALAIEGEVKASPQTALGVIMGVSHSGKDKGIMRSVTRAGHANKPVVAEIVRCLQVNSADQYAERCGALDTLTKKTQADERPARFGMVVWRIQDDTGLPITDFDVLILAGAAYDPDLLPKGFFKDRQKNSVSENTLTYYLNHDLMSTMPDGKVGFRVIARPSEGFAWYAPGEFWSNDLPLDALLRANETLIVDIVMKRRVDKEAFRLDGADADGNLSRVDFKKQAPSGGEI